MMWAVAGGNMWQKPKGASVDGSDNSNLATSRLLNIRSTTYTCALSKGTQLIHLAHDFISVRRTWTLRVGFLDVDGVLSHGRGEW